MREHRFNWKEERPDYNIQPSTGTVMSRLLDGAVSDSFKAKVVDLRTCLSCGSCNTYVQPNGVAQWHKRDRGFICNKCYFKKWYLTIGRSRRYPVQEYPVEVYA